MSKNKAKRNSPRRRQAMHRGKQTSTKQKKPVTRRKDFSRAGKGKSRKKRHVHKMKPWQIALICIGVLIAALFMFGVIYVYAKWSKIDTKAIKAEDIVINEEVKKNKNVDLGDGFTNVALFGVDSRDGDLGEGNRTDCIIVASLNNKTKEIKMVSVYRDTLLDLSEGTYQKCNAAYSYGGPVLAINMLNMNLDLDIQDYVTVDFGAIADAVDLLGGIEIEVTEEELPYINQYIPETATSAGKAANLLQSAGLQKLDGTQATTYARIRSTAGGDFTRTERQRLVIEKMFEKAKMADIGTLNAIIDKVFPQVSTSFTLPEILKYASAYSEYKLTGNMGFPEDKYTDMLSEIGSVVVPDDLTSNVAKLHEFLFGTVGYSPSSTVQTVSANIAYTASAKQSSGTGTETTYEENGTYYDSGYSDNGGIYDNGSSGGNYGDGSTDTSGQPGSDGNNTGAGDNTGGGTVDPPVTPDGGTDSGGGQTETPPEGMVE
jgi:LCP family protein required for cell wall assembly